MSSSSLFPFTRHGFLWRVWIYRDPSSKVGSQWVRAWTRWGARRLAGVPETWTISRIERTANRG